MKKESRHISTFEVGDVITRSEGVDYSSYSKETGMIRRKDNSYQGLPMKFLSITNDQIILQVSWFNHPINLSLDAWGNGWLLYEEPQIRGDIPLLVDNTDRKFMTLTDRIDAVQQKCLSMQESTDMKFKATAEALEAFKELHQTNHYVLTRLSRKVNALVIAGIIMMIAISCLLFM